MVHMKSPAPRIQLNFHTRIRARPSNMEIGRFPARLSQVLPAAELEAAVSEL
jgi:hypothetical protein